MIYLPKCLYFFRHSRPLSLSSFFRRLESVVISFVWAGKPPRVAKRILYLSLSGGAGTFQFFNILLGSSTGQCEMVVLPASAELSGYTGDGSPRLIRRAVESGVLGWWGSPLHDGPNENHDPGVAVLQSSSP